MSLVSVANLLLSQAYVVRVTVPDLVNATATFVNHHIRKRKSPGAGPGMPQLHLLAISAMTELPTMVTA